MGDAIWGFSSTADDAMSEADRTMSSLLEGTLHDAVIAAARKVVEAQKACDREAERTSPSSAPMVRYINALAQLRDALAKLDAAGDKGDEP